MTARRYLAVEGCDSAVRPCRNVACHYSLPGLIVEPEEGEEPMPVYTCALDFAEDNPDGATLEAVGDQLGVTRERVRQIEARAVSSLLVAMGRARLDVTDEFRAALSKAKVEIAKTGEIEHVAPDAPLALEDVASMPRFARRLAACRKVA